MHVSTINVTVPDATDIIVTEDSLTAELSDGRTITVPIVWYPRLVHATPEERTNWRLIGGGEGIHWPDLDEDISIEGMLAGWPSREGPNSLRMWLDARKEGRSVAYCDLIAYEKEREKSKQHS